MVMKKLVIVLLLLSSVVVFADDSKISPDLLPYLNSNTKVQVIVQYAPGTQVSCSGLFGLISCVTNDILNLGGSILSQIPLVNGVVALIDGTGLVNLSND